MPDELDPEDDGGGEVAAGAAVEELVEGVVELELDPQAAITIEPSTRTPRISRRIDLVVFVIQHSFHSQAVVSLSNNRTPARQESFLIRDSNALQS